MDETTKEFQEIVVQINSLKYVGVNNALMSIEGFLSDLEWLQKIVIFSKSFAEFTHDAVENPVEIQNKSDDPYVLNNSPPFLVYKNAIKQRYAGIIHMMKGVYRNALKLPDVEKIYMIIDKEFNHFNHLYLKNPEFIFDHFVYHVYSYGHIHKNYPEIMEALKIFTFLYYKLINHIKELEFDACSISDILNASYSYKNR